MNKINLKILAQFLFILALASFISTISFLIDSRDHAIPILKRVMPLMTLVFGALYWQVEKYRGVGNKSIKKIPDEDIFETLFKKKLKYTQGFGKRHNEFITNSLIYDDLDLVVNHKIRVVGKRNSISYVISDQFETGGYIIRAKMNQRVPGRCLAYLKQGNHHLKAAKSIQEKYAQQFLGIKLDDEKPYNTFLFLSDNQEIFKTYFTKDTLGKLSTIGEIEPLDETRFAVFQGEVLFSLSHHVNLSSTIESIERFLLALQLEEIHL